MSEPKENITTTELSPQINADIEMDIIETTGEDNEMASEPQTTNTEIIAETVPIIPIPNVIQSQDLLEPSASTSKEKDKSKKDKESKKERGDGRDEHSKAHKDKKKKKKKHKHKNKHKHKEKDKDKHHSDKDRHSLDRSSGGSTNASPIKFS